MKARIAVEAGAVDRTRRGGCGKGAASLYNVSQWQMHVIYIRIRQVAGANKGESGSQSAFVDEENKERHTNPSCSGPVLLGPLALPPCAYA